MKKLGKEVHIDGFIEHLEGSCSSVQSLSSVLGRVDLPLLLCKSHNVFLDSNCALSNWTNQMQK